MPEEVLFETESKLPRAEIANVLRDVADKLDANGPVTLAVGNDSITLNPPANPTFEVKAERETSKGAAHGELSIEFELEWDERDEGTDGSDRSLSVE